MEHERKAMFATLTAALTVPSGHAEDDARRRRFFRPEAALLLVVLAACPPSASAPKPPSVPPKIGTVAAVPAAPERAVEAGGDGQGQAAAPDCTAPLATLSRGGQSTTVPVAPASMLDLTLEAWIRARSNGTWNGIASLNNGWNATNQIALYMNAAYVTWGQYNSRNITGAPSVDVTDGRWHLVDGVVATVSKGGVYAYRLYLDGRLAAQTMMSSHFTGGGPGTTLQAGTAVQNGAYDDAAYLSVRNVRIYCTALTERAIRSNYADGPGEAQAATPPTVALPPAPVPPRQGQAAPVAAPVAGSPRPSQRPTFEGPPDRDAWNAAARYYGAQCSYGGTCGDLVLISCHPEVDGPEFYVRKGTGEVVETCGGACMGGRCMGPHPVHHCPPAGWTCRWAPAAGFGRSGHR